LPSFEQFAAVRLSPFLQHLPLLQFVPSLEHCFPLHAKPSPLHAPLPQLPEEHALLPLAPLVKVIVSLPGGSQLPPTAAGHLQAAVADLSHPQFS
jgi:hypothetical protein